jgi:hypothetical protein
MAGTAIGIGFAKIPTAISDTGASPGADGAVVHAFLTRTAGRIASHGGSHADMVLWIADEADIGGRLRPLAVRIGLAGHLPCGIHRRRGRLKLNGRRTVVGREARATAFLTGGGGAADQARLAADVRPRLAAVDIEITVHRAVAATPEFAPFLRLRVLGTFRAGILGVAGRGEIADIHGKEIHAHHRVPAEGADGRRTLGRTLVVPFAGDGRRRLRRARADKQKSLPLATRDPLRVGGAAVAGVSAAVAVGVGLIGIGHSGHEEGRGAIVTDVADAVAVFVGLAWISHDRAVVGVIRNGVQIRIGDVTGGFSADPPASAMNHAEAKRPQEKRPQ